MAGGGIKTKSKDEIMGNTALKTETALSMAVNAAWETAETNEQAANNLLAIMRRDEAVYGAAVEPHLQRIASDLVGAAKRQRRAYIWRRPGDPDQRVSALTRINSVTLFDMRLPSGKRLGDAVKEEVEEAATSYRDAAAYHNSKAKFFASIASRLKGGKTVSQVFKPAELEELRDA